MNKDWNKLLEFETRDLVENFIINRFERKPTQSKIYEINSNFTQGREYFKSAKNADFTVKPLLQYYGVLALSKGLILSLKPNILETNLKASHGLEIKNWKEVLKSKDYGKLEITIGNGSFSELINATSNRNYLRANSSEVNMISGLEKPAKGCIISLEQLIQYYPDLDVEFKSWTGRNLVYAVIDGFNPYDKKNIKVSLSGRVDESHLDLLFPTKYCKNRDFKNQILKYESTGWGPNITQKWDNPLNVGQACVIPVLGNDIGLNLISGMFVISYVFGMMARYYPTAWISLRKGEKGDRIYPFVSRMIEFIDDKFPKVIVDFLNAPYPLLDK